VGSTPWTVAHPLVMSMAAATVELGYRQPMSYRDAVRGAVHWAVQEVEAAARREESWQDVFPSLAARAQADHWFDYDAEDDFLRGRTTSR
jgi:hypothetical protein